MIQKTQMAIEQELGTWETPVSAGIHLLELRLVKSDNDIKLHIPNPDSDVTMLARPKGFQLTSHYNNEIRCDFAIENSQIVSVELLPSFTVDNYSKLSLKYILFSIIIFLFVGSLTTQKSELLFLWLFLGATFGMSLSINFKKYYRQNLLLVIKEKSDQNVTLLFSIDKRQRKQCVDFFNNYIKDKFTHD